MKFCISAVTYWESHGFSTANWRKSLDGTLAIVHEEYAKVLIPGIDTDINATTYIYPSDELSAVLNSPAWAVAEG